MTNKMKYFAFFKPFNVLSQFTREDAKSTLANFGFPKNTYPIGRLDFDSEGLLILTNDISLNNKLLNPKNKHKRTYWVQLDGSPNETDLDLLRTGVEINISGKTHRTLPAEVTMMDSPNVPDRFPPIRFRANIPTTWIKLTLTEGKNRQVRKMTAKIGFPTLRLIRYSIEELTIENLMPGEMKSYSKTEIFKLLNID